MESKEDSNVTNIEEYLDRIRAADINDTASFRSLIADGLALTSLSDADFAEKIRTSRPTVTRWRNGTTVPHPALRQAILDKMRKEAERASRIAKRAIKEATAKH